jgi:uncharacterized membrane protein
MSDSRSDQFDTFGADVPPIRRLGTDDIRAALADGWADFKARAALRALLRAGLRARPSPSMSASSARASRSGSSPSPSAFPCRPPSPRSASTRSAGDARRASRSPGVWRDILGVVIREKDRQIPWIGAILVIVFLFWSFFAHMLFALFMGLSTLTNISSSYEAFLTPTGITMLATQVVVGGAVAFLVFSLTVVSLPLLLEREVDFVTAMLHSMRTVAQSLPVMLLWAAIIATLLFVGMIPYFLGLFVVLPILGHATWHLYRRALYDPV